ncbi:hypothetical protein SAMN05421678_112146 [Actinopolymorpha cephalotaxi]|uniref:Nitroreductase family protein n=1 Tax=Actinopolymorpha cephalotaxi TaxID=504797 RepID=A0A1I2XEA4_9ACTN|nr:hypothetical protein [Actinopolymorpha cephalotaxi]NYH86211.1 hypothetical protein [Actinopolymorpha cephalotaxi]SFH11742.1 hypothetical protein SAMN05421678_112146 [Actinopolymorpha cephalotaxi]
MIARELDPTERELLVRAAILAPTTYEARPWRFDVDGDTVDVSRDPGESSADFGEDPGDFGEDSGGRRAMVCVGAALFNLRVAAAALARGTTTRLLPDPSRPDLLAQVRVWPGPGAEVCLAGLLLHLYRPRQGRLPYADRRIPPAIRLELERAAAAEGTTLSWADDGHHDGPADLDGAGCRDGVLDGGLCPLPYEDLWTRAVLTMPAASPTSLTSATAGACPRDWMVAGQALQRVFLVAAGHGLSGSLDELDELDRLSSLGGSHGFDGLDGSVGWPGTFGPSYQLRAGGPAQVRLRLGWGPSVASTPPRPLADVVADDVCCTLEDQWTWPSK